MSQGTQIGRSSQKESFTVGENSRLLLIAGPCQLESKDHAKKIAETLLEITATLPIDLVFKASYDKANRTSLDGVRGLGMEKGLKVLSEIRNELSVPVLTDIHESDQASIAAEAVDVIQIPAFLCRQTDLLIAAGKTGKTINIKKGQFLHPADMEFAAQKVSSTGNKNILLCERGTSFGYRDLVVDMRGLVIMKNLEYPVIFDATHSVQSMGGAGGKSSGNRSYVEPLAKAAVSVGVDGLFIECHPHPDNAPSDGPNMLHLHQMKDFLTKICRLREALI